MKTVGILVIFGEIPTESVRYTRIIRNFITWKFMKREKEGRKEKKMK